MSTLAVWWEYILVNVIICSFSGGQGSEWIYNFKFTFASQQEKYDQSSC